MKYIGASHVLYQQILFLIFSIIAGLQCLYQLVFLQKLNLIPVYIAPLLSFYICFENAILFNGDKIGSNSNEAQACYVFRSLQVSTFIIVLFEMVYRLHELRKAHFFFIPFDEDSEGSHILGEVVVGTVRFLSIGVFVMSILSDFEFVSANGANKLGGYAFLDTYPTSKQLLLVLIPTMILSLFAIFLGVAMFRYGNRMALQTSNSQFWKLLMLSGVAYFVANIFGPSIYQWTSNLGSILLLTSTTVLIKLVQDDLDLARDYIEFLRRSNCVFQELEDNQTGSSRTVVLETLKIQTLDSKPTPFVPAVSMGTIFPHAIEPVVVELPSSSEMSIRLMKSPRNIETGSSANAEDLDKLSIISIESSWDSQRNSNASTPKNLSVPFDALRELDEPTDRVSVMLATDAENRI